MVVRRSSLACKGDGELSLPAVSGVRRVKDSRGTADRFCETSGDACWRFVKCASRTFRYSTGRLSLGLT
jgi:hypothetical protein